MPKNRTSQWGCWKEKLYFGNIYVFNVFFSCLLFVFPQYWHILEGTGCCVVGAFWFFTRHPSTCKITASHFGSALKTKHVPKKDSWTKLRRAAKGRWMSLGSPFYRIFNPVEDTISQFIWTGNSELQHGYSAQLSWTKSWQSTSYQIECADSKLAAAAAALAAPAENQTPIVCWSLSKCRLQASAIFFSRLVLLWNTKKTQNCMAKTNSFGKPEQQCRAMKIPFNC